MKIVKSLVVAFLVSFSSWCFADSVNINTADAQTIAKLVKGVGPNRAEAIVAYRDQNGAFASVSELKKVKGVGDKIIAQNQDILVASESDQ